MFEGSGVAANIRSPEPCHRDIESEIKAARDRLRLSGKLKEVLEEAYDKGMIRGWEERHSLMEIFGLVALGARRHAQELDQLLEEQEKGQ